MPAPRPRFVTILTAANLAVFSFLLVFGVLPSMFGNVPDGYSVLSARLGTFYVILYSSICVGAWTAHAGKRYGRNVLLIGLGIFPIVVCFVHVSAHGGALAWSPSTVGGLALIVAWSILNCWLLMFSPTAKTFYGWRRDVTKL